MKRKRESEVEEELQPLLKKLWKILEPEDQTPKTLTSSEATGKLAKRLKAIMEENKQLQTKTAAQKKEIRRLQAREVELLVHVTKKDKHVYALKSYVATLKTTLTSR